jgi:methyl-accepting chemotaxis protein
MFRNLTVGKKIGFGFALVLAITAVLGTVGTTQMLSVKGGVDDLANVHIPLTEAISTVDALATSQNLNVSLFVVHKETEYVDAFGEDDQGVDEHLEEAQAIIAGDQDLVDMGFASAVDEIAESHDAFVTACRALIEVVQTSEDPEAVMTSEGVETATTGDPEAIMTAADAVEDAYEPFMAKVDALLEANAAEAEGVSEGAAGAAQFAQAVMLSLSAAAVVVGAVLAFVIARGIVKALKRVIEGLTVGSEQTSSAAGQVSSASQSLAQGASEAAAAIEETTASVEEMSSMIKTNAGNAGEARTLAESASNAASKGADAMTRMSGAIDDIKKSSDETAKIIKTIDEIAFQTNLLALNAAVEAARAGEAGKGFAVVAEEVRNLAQRSAEAARNTADLIEESVKNSDNGVAISKEVGSALEEIADGSGKVNDLVAEIAAASNEQSQGADQINQAVSQMDTVTQSNAANAEESASASEELSAQAEELNKMVQELQVMVGGSKARSSFERDGGHKVQQAANLQTTDHVWHQIAATPAGEQQADDAPSAEEVIPMAEDTGLSKF